MKRTLLSLGAATLVLGVGLLSSALTAGAAPPSAASSAGAAGASLSASASAQTASERSPVPTAQEWQTATPMQLRRVSPAAAGCKATRVREWLRVRCPQRTFALSLLGGSNEGLAFWIGPEEQGAPGEVQFPLRRGDRRVLQFWAQGKDAQGEFVPEPALVLQEHWLPGEESPFISLL